MMKTKVAAALSVLIVTAGIVAMPAASAAPGPSPTPGSSFCEKVKNIINKYRPGTPTRTDGLGHIRPSKPKNDG